MDYIKKNIIGVVALVIAIIGCFAPAVKQTTNALGSVACSDTTCLTGGLRILTGALETDGTFQLGSSGSSISQILSGTGALIYSDSSVTASTTRAFDIAVTGVVSTDKVFTQAATTTAASLGWEITGASASSTAGFITLDIANQSGATGNIPRNIASSTAYLIIR